MKKLFTRTTVATAISLFAFNGAAIESADFTATVEVQNSFDFEVSNGLSFGTLRTNSDPAETASIIVSPRGIAAVTSTTGGAAVMSELVAGSPASFTVAGASAFATLNLDSSAVAGPIAYKDSAPPGTPGFVLSAPTFYVITGASPNSVATTTIQVDGNGAATFNMGATLTTTTSTASYLDGTYEGQFTLTLDY